MATVVSFLAPCETLEGSVPKASFTLSSSSSTVSSVALKVSVLEVSPALKVTLDGTPE